MSTLARLLLLSCLGACTSASAATFTFRFKDAQGVGFFDTTTIPADQAGNNPATTLGEARRNVLMEAGRIWGGLLVSNVPIVVDAVFRAQTCDATTGTLASAGASTFFADITNDPTISRDTFFVSALADSLAGRDLIATEPDVPANRRNDPDISATFNISVDSDPNCLGARGFYYGFDSNEGTRIDLLAVALHELAHGFGFASEVDSSTGAAGLKLNGMDRFSSFVTQLFDESTGATWPNLTAAQRMASAVSVDKLAWNGTNVNTKFTAFAPGVTGAGRLRLFAPATVSEGSSVSHWDTSATPNLLMEPRINRDLTRSVDVTVCALKDIGWQVTRCPDTNIVATGRPPVSSQQTVTAVEDTAISITLTATDPDGDMLTYTTTSQPAKGSISSGTGATRIYTPSLNANGTDTFTFVANDGNGNTSAPATVTINVAPVNDPPVAVGLLAQITSGQSSTITLSGSDVDNDASTLTYEIVTNPANGTLSGSGVGRIYQSNAGFVGTDSFTYRVRDASTASNTATVTINVVAAASSTPTPGGRGGGGGAMNELLLAALALLAITTRLYKLRAAPQRTR